MEIDGRMVDLGEPGTGKGKQANKDKSLQAKQEQARGMQKQMAKSAPPERRVFVGNLPKEVRYRFADVECFGLVCFCFVTLFGVRVLELLSVKLS